MARYLLLPLLFSLACSSTEPAIIDSGTTADTGTAEDSGIIPDTGTGADSGPADAEPVDTGPVDTGVTACPTLNGEVVSVTTEDGLTLQADLHTTGTAGGPAVVLLHMIPPNNTRTNYPPAFREAVAAAGITVLNLDRRGAGGPAALARTAYTGPDGKLDAQAGIDFLLAHPCAPNAARIGLVGASNGTTTIVDWSIFVATANRPAPKALVYLTGGGYTETNNSIAQNRAALEPIPSLFVFSTAERAWSAGLQGGPTIWEFEEYDPGAHGTQMFGSRPESIQRVVTFLSAQL